jgi:Asp-tRNA(Asn)/Glu-tRNA(Gln) amidotransferase B subunit
VKNLNSFRSILRAVRFEAARHRAILHAGGAVTRQTRSFDAATGGEGESLGIGFKVYDIESRV